DHDSLAAGHTPSTPLIKRSCLSLIATSSLIHCRGNLPVIHSIPLRETLVTEALRPRSTFEPALGISEATMPDLILPTPAGHPPFAYDVFVSHSSQDQEWVLGWLIPKLEAAGLKPCYYQEHFDPARPILKNIALAIEQSRKTVLVLSPAWLQSEWSELEALMAQQRSPAFRNRQ